MINFKQIKISRRKHFIKKQMQHFVLQAVHQEIYFKIFQSIQIDHSFILLVSRVYKSEQLYCIFISFFLSITDSRDNFQLFNYIDSIFNGKLNLYAN